MANPMYGLNKHDEVLHDLAKMFVAGKAGGSASLQITAIEKVIDAESTTNITCGDAMPGSGNGNAQVWGGYIEVSGISGGATVDLDFGITNHLTVYQEAVSANGIYGLDAPSYEASGEDVIITITTNGSTSPIKCRMVFLSCKPVTS